MDQVMRPRQRVGTTTTTTTAKRRIKREEEVYFHWRQVVAGKKSKTSKLNRKQGVRKPHQREEITIAAPPYFSSIIEPSFDTTRRKWIFGERKKILADPLKSNSGYLIDKYDNYMETQNRLQQMNCPDEKKEVTLETREHFQLANDNMSVDAKINCDEDKNESENFIYEKDNFLKMPPGEIPSSIDSKSKEHKIRALPETRFLLKTRSFSSVRKRRSEIGVVDRTVNYLFLALLIMVARELYTKTRCNSTSNHPSNFQSQASTAVLISQRCLSELVLIRSCSAASTLAKTTTNITEGRPASENLQPLNPTASEEKAGVTMTEAQQMKTTSSKPMLNTSPKDATTTTTTDAAATTLVEGNNNNRTTMDSSKTANLRHQIHKSQLSVLCNSRCNCVILEPKLFGKPGNQVAPVIGELPPAGFKKKEEEETASPAADPFLTNNTMAKSSSQTSEEALIAFNEDYSLDYEQPVSLRELETVVATTATTTTTTMINGSESYSKDDPTSVKAAEIASTTIAKNNRDYAINNSTTVSSPLTTMKLDIGGNSSSRAGCISASSTTNKTRCNNNNNSSDISDTALTTPVNSTRPVETNSILNLSDVAGSSRQSQPLQTKQVMSSGGNINTNSPNLNKQTTSQQQQHKGMSLVPLPPHHLHLHHHHHHGAGAGRDSSGPQLYAQSLYSSQAPKLSYHAYTPYLKTSPSQTSININNNNNNNNNNNPNTGQHQQLLLQQTTGNQNSFANSDKIHQDTSIFNTFSLSPPISPSNPLTSGGGSQNSPLQYHHMRSNYAAHHLRLQQQQVSAGQASPNSMSNVDSPINSNNFIASKTNYVFPQQFILVPLKTLNMSQKLRFSSPQRNNNSNNTSFNNEANDTEDHYQDIENNWKDFPELIENIELMLDEIDGNQIQSLNLSRNDLQFELWSELYALLAIQMRQYLFHLDLSHNSLIKLGITFTGYIEHHIAAHNGWPIQQQQHQLVDSNQSVVENTKSNPALKASKVGSKNSRMRHSLFSGGKLYNLIKDKRKQTNPLQLKNDKTNSNNLHHNTSNLLQQALLIKALDLSHNKLKWLVKDQFRALKYVQTIRLDYNRIRYIHQHAFSGLESLRFLNLNFNRLQVIYIEQFQTNYNLLALMLRSNYLAYLRGGSFASLANLKRLDLSSNKLTIVSNNAFLGLESLELLNCSSNQFVHAPSASLHPLTSLRKFDLSDNLISQLAPGTFFHLPIEELWLNQNEQLVAIDRGAFWDLPYLRKLHLSSNPMLMSINSQAFVGTQSLQSIDVEDCQSIDDSARQMLDNITMTTTSRLLRYSGQQQQQQQQQQPIKNIENINSTVTKQIEVDPNNSSSSATAAAITTSPDVLNDFTNHSQSIQLVENSSKPNTSPKRSLHQVNQQILGQQNNRLRYIYYASMLTFLVVALKLVFKYTSTSHYMEARLRRRRVYEANSNKLCSSNNIGNDCFTDTDDGNSMSSSNVDAFPMCVQPESHLFGLGNTTGVINNSNSNNNSNNNSNSNTDSVNNNNNVGSEQMTVGNVVEQQCLSPGTHETGGLENGQQHQQQVVSEHGEASIDISVISNSVSSVIPNSTNSPPTCCPDCPQQAQHPLPQNVGEIVMGETDESGGNSDQVAATSEQDQNQRHQRLHNLADTQPAPDHSTFDLLHSQLVAAGFDYGHANCAHFYQFLGPALQLADITASYVNHMDYY